MCYSFRHADEIVLKNPRLLQLFFYKCPVERVSFLKNHCARHGHIDHTVLCHHVQDEHMQVLADMHMQKTKKKMEYISYHSPLTIFTALSCCIKFRLSSKCQSSMRRPFLMCNISIAKNSISLFVGACPINSPLNVPRKTKRAVTLSPTINKSSTEQLRSGTALRKFTEANFGPSGPWGRPFGSVLSIKLGATTAFR